jgi:hypothetical protein
LKAVKGVTKFGMAQIIEFIYGIVAGNHPVVAQGSTIVKVIV